MSTGVEYKVDYMALCLRAEEEVRDLKAKVEAQDKIINFLVQCGDTKSAELRHLREKIRSSPFVQ